MNNSSKFHILTVFSIFLFFLCCFPDFAVAQDKYSIFGKVKIENGSIENTRITILKNAEKMESGIVDNSGKFEYELDFGNEYIFEFSKEGFVTKKVSISTFVPLDILSRDNQFPPFKFMVSLFPAYEGLDLSVFDQPMGMIMYDKELDDFDYDRDYDAQIRDAIKKAEEEAKKRAVELEAQRLAKERAYKAAIQRGDVNFDAKKYDLSKAGYNEALAIMPDEDYPKAQLQKIDELIGQELANAEEKARLEAERKALEERYLALITQADNQFETKDYKLSKANYTSALEVKPSEAYPKNQIQKISDLLVQQAQLEADKKAMEEKYASIIAIADSQFSSGDYQTSKSTYSDALSLKSEEEYPKSQILKIDGILADQQAEADEAARLVAEKKALDEKYASIINLADSQFSSGDYQTSKSTYSDALSLKANETYPKSQIQKIDGIIAKQLAEADEAARLLAEKKALDEKYASIINLADSQFSSGDYQTSKSTYSDALSLKANETYPKFQIQKIDGILAQQLAEADEAARLASQKKALDEKYESVVALADSQFSAGDYDSAKNTYKDALNLKLAEAYPKTQIQKINEILDAQQAEADKATRLLAEKKALDEKYASIIQLADSQLSSSDYQSSKTSYTDALSLKVDEVYPKSQIQKIDNILANQQAEAENAKRLLAEKKALDEKYASVIKLADTQFSSEEYQSAKTNYTEALRLKAGEAYPKTQIQKIDVLLANQQAEANEAARLASQKKALDDKYASIIALADSQFSSSDYQSSRTSYKDALELKGKESYPKAQIQKIDDILSEQKRLAEEEARLAIEKKGLDEKYNSFISLADSQFSSETYESARKNYTLALEIRSNENYPKTQIQKINEIVKQLKAKAEEEARIAEALRATEREYSNCIALADKYYEGKRWQSAIGEYEKAQKLKPKDIYPPNQIEEIKLILKELEKLEEEKSTLQYQYKALLEEADQFFGREEYTSAIGKYQGALELKPAESYPKNQLKRIEVLLEQQAREAEKLKELNRLYGEEIKLGDKFLKKEQFSVARHHFNSALSMKPDEEYPKQKLEEIEKLVEALKLADKEVVSNNPTNFEKKLSIAKEREYASKIAKADDSFNASHFTVAKVMYERALELFDRDYPKKKLKEIDKLIREGKNSELTEEYRKLIARGDEELTKKNYSVAKFYYQKAKGLDTSEKYADKQLDKIEEFINSKKNQKLEAEYKKVVTQADEAYNKGNYSVARFYYRKAANLKSNESYPKERLQLIKENQGNK
ncbi:tetratricopeptide repeat protein [Labilibaculum euxinus]